jgi:cellulose biosynthesis protein BcsQ
MSRYALWNNKGGVGKSFLTFAVACEYAMEHPDEIVLVMDLCPQANLTEMLLGGKDSASTALREFYSEKPRRSVGGYFEARLSSPFMPLSEVANFVVIPHKYNNRIPENVALLPGDNLLELLSEAIRQASQMALPVDAWSKINSWLLDFYKIYSDQQPSEVAAFIDCNPSFSIYTQIALCASEYVVVPYTADDSSRRGIENIFALLYGVTSSELAAYARISFNKRATEELLSLPKIHTFVSNRVTMYKGKPSSAWLAKSGPIKNLISEIRAENKKLFVSHHQSAGLFVDMPDYHTVAVVSSSEGCPLSDVTPGHHDVDGDIVQVNKSSLDKYKKAIKILVDRM